MNLQLGMIKGRNVKEILFSSQEQVRELMVANENIFHPIPPATLWGIPIRVSTTLALTGISFALVLKEEMVLFFSDGRQVRIPSADMKFEIGVIPYES